MSSVTKLIGLEMFSGPSQPDRSKPQTDLLIALRNDNYEEFEYILTNYGKWIDINYLYEGPDNKTLLDIACSCKKKAKFVECLLACGAVVNSLNKLHGKAPIHLAVLYSDFDTLKLLVENPGIDINYRDKEGINADEDEGVKVSSFVNAVKRGEGDQRGRREEPITEGLRSKFLALQ